MSKHTHCDKCGAVVPQFSDGKGSDGLDRQLILVLGNYRASADLCPPCYVEVFTMLRAILPGNLTNVTPAKLITPA